MSHHTVTYRLAESRLDSAFNWNWRESLDPGEAVELARLFDKNDETGLVGADRERCEELLARAYADAPVYAGPDERY